MINHIKLCIFSLLFIALPAYPMEEKSNNDSFEIRCPLYNQPTKNGTLCTYTSYHTCPINHENKIKNILRKHLKHAHITDYQELLRDVSEYYTPLAPGQSVQPRRKRNKYCAAHWWKQQALTHSIEAQVVQITDYPLQTQCDYPQKKFKSNHEQ